MTEQRSRPVPKRRSVHLGTNTNDSVSTTDLYGSSSLANSRTSAGKYTRKSFIDGKCNLVIILGIKVYPTHSLPSLLYV